MGKDADEIRREIEFTRDDIGDTVEAIGYRANVVGRMKDSLGDTLDAAKRKVSDAMPDADDLREGARTVVSTVQENPLLFAVGAFAAGLLIGMAIPTTSMEKDAMGSTARRLKDKAKEVGRDVMDQGSQVARETAEAMKSSAQRHGNEVVSRLKESAADRDNGAMATAPAEGQGI